MLQLSNPSNRMPEICKTTCSHKNNTWEVITLTRSLKMATNVNRSTTLFRKETSFERGHVVSCQYAKHPHRKHCCETTNSGLENHF